jgi:hypothetical protein
LFNVATFVKFVLGNPCMKSHLNLISMQFSDQGKKIEFCEHLKQDVLFIALQLFYDLFGIMFFRRFRWQQFWV